MQYINLIFLMVVTVVVLLFVVQNTVSTTASFFSWSVTLPLSLIVLITYGLGALTGGLLIGSFRSLIHGATKKQKRE